MVGVALAIGQEAVPHGGREVEEIICHRTENGEVSWVLCCAAWRGAAVVAEGRTRAC
jgi:hypothetical protein